MGVLLTLLPLAGTPVMAQGQNPPSNQSFVGGNFIAKNYNYPGVRIFSGNTTGAGAATFALSAAGVRLADGRTIMPFSAGGLNILGQPGAFPAIPIIVGAGATRETVTPTAVSGCYIGAPQGSCQITATFLNAHGQGELVSSGSFGIQEAINDAAFWGGGEVNVDSSENLNFGASSVTAAVVAALPMPNVSIIDERNMTPVYWNPQGGATVLSAPATLTAVTALPSTTPVGTFTATNYNMCIAYVDAMGQEGNCSTSFVNTGAGATSSFIFSPPAATAGAVGYTIYIGLTAAGSTTLQYKVPLVTQPSAVGVYPAANGVCTLTLVETITPACAVANTSYGQLGATATVTAITVNTSSIQPVATTASTTSVYVPSPGGRTTFLYAPGSHIGAFGTAPASLAFTITTAAATVTPNVVGTLNLQPGMMNQLGKTLEICGEATSTATAATIEDIQFQWDSMGQNTAGKGVLIGDLGVTNTLASTGHLTFCADFQTTVVSATATGGSINHVGGFIGSAGVTTAAASGGGDVVTPGAIGSLNLALDARINIIYLHTTATDGAGWILQYASAQLK
jgi:hypothetical protein